MKLNEKKGDRDREREIKKNKWDIFLLEEQPEKFVAAVTTWEMLAATIARWNWAAVKKKVNENTYDISAKNRVTMKFPQVSRCSRAKQRQRNVQKKRLQVQSCFFVN